MGKVNDERLERILEIYEKPWRFLQSAETDYPLVHGVFLVGEAQYATVPVKHLTGIQAQACMNQLSYVAFAEWILENRFHDIQMTFEQYLRCMREQMLIAETDTQIRFRDKISTGQPIDVAGTLDRFRKHKDNFYAFMKYDFQGGKAEGSMLLVLQK